MKKYLLFVCIILVSSCVSNSEDELYGDSICDTNNASFVDEILPIIRTSCAVTGCHVQGGNGNGIFENYNQIKAKVDNGSFRDRVIVQRDMPPSQPLGDCELDHIRQWLDDGAPNN